MRAWLLIWIIAPLIGACSSAQNLSSESEGQTDSEDLAITLTETAKRAVIRRSSAETQAALMAVLAEAMPGAEITLSEMDLIESPQLTIDRVPMRSLDNHPINGRRLDKPDRFVLYKMDGQCVLHHTNTDKLYPLEGVDCLPIAPDQ